MKYSKHLSQDRFHLFKDNNVLFTSLLATCFITENKGKIFGSHRPKSFPHYASKAPSFPSNSTTLISEWQSLPALARCVLFFFMQYGQGPTDISTLHINSIFSINNLLPFSQIFQGNTNPTDVAKTMLPKPTLTRFVRIRPVTWETGIALRFEVYGCKISGGWSACTLACAPQFDLCSQVINSAHVQLVWQVLFCLLCIPIMVPVAQTLPGVWRWWISLLRVELAAAL